MQIKIEVSKNWCETRCPVCDKWEKHFHVAPIVYDDNDENIGYLCTDCLKADTQAIKEKLTNRAKDLRQLAKYLDCLSNQDIVVPTFGEYEEKMRLEEEAFTN